MSDDNAAAARTPADFLKSIKGKPVVVKLNSGVDYRGDGADSNIPDITAGKITKFYCLIGILACLDGYMNIAMEQTEVSRQPCTCGPCKWLAAPTYVPYVCRSMCRGS